MRWRDSRSGELAQGEAALLAETAHAITERLPALFRVNTHLNGRLILDFKGKRAGRGD
jgi:hypothetical protein